MFAEAAAKTPEELLLGAETEKIPLLLHDVFSPAQEGQFSLAQESLVLILQGSERVKESLPLVQNKKGSQLWEYQTKRDPGISIRLQFMLPTAHPDSFGLHSSIHPTATPSA